MVSYTAMWLLTKFDYKAGRLLDVCINIEHKQPTEKELSEVLSGVGKISERLSSNSKLQINPQTFVMFVLEKLNPC